MGYRGPAPFLASICSRPSLATHYSLAIPNIPWPDPGQTQRLNPQVLAPYPHILHIFGPSCSHLGVFIRQKYQKYTIYGALSLFTANM